MSGVSLEIERRNEHDDKGAKIRVATNWRTVIVIAARERPRGVK